MKTVSKTFFFEKRSKKLLVPRGFGLALAQPDKKPGTNKSFLVLFFKKERPASSLSPHAFIPDKP